MKKIYTLGDIDIYTAAFPFVDERMYVFRQEKNIIVVDPFKCDEVVAKLKAWGVLDVLIILTHEHIDHITGVNLFRENFDAHVLASEHCAELITDPKTNLARYFYILHYACGGDEESLKDFDTEYKCHADETFEGTHAFEWFGHQITLTETPGHSLGGICILIDNEVVCTGDSLINGHKVRTRDSGGGKMGYLKVTKPYLLSLDKDIIVLPGHGDMNTLEYLMPYMEFAD